MSSPLPARPRHRMRPAVAATVFIALAYGISWTVWLVGMPRDHSTIADPGFYPFLLVGSFGPLLAAVAVCWLDGGRPAVVALLRRWGRLRARWWVWMLVFFLFPTAAVAVNLTMGIRFDPEVPVGLALLTMIVAMPLNGLVGGVLLGAGPIGEETGWRGYLLPTVLTRFGDLGSSVVIGVLWGLWHGPLFVFDDWRGGGVSATLYIPLYLLVTSVLAYCFLWFMRWSRGSIAVAVMLHGVVNTTLTLMESDLWDLGSRSPETLLFQSFLVPVVVALVLAAVGRSRAARAVTTGPEQWRLPVREQRLQEPAAQRRRHSITRP